MSTLKPHTMKIALWELDPEGFHIVTSGRLHGTPVRLLIDTGANHSCFDRNFIESLQIPIHETEKDDVNIGIGGSEFQSDILTISHFKIGRILVPPSPFRLLDLQPVCAAYENVGFKPIHGIIGGDLLHRFHAVIDYGNKTLTLYK